MTRSCGSSGDRCTLCCRLVPVHELEKGAGVRCAHQRTGKGCRIHGTQAVPFSCRIWTCGWLLDPERTKDLRRPDRAGYVIDCTKDFVTATPPDGGAPFTVECVQVWCDPARRDAWRDPALLAVLDSFGEEGCAALIRFSNVDGITVFPPSMTGAGWVEKHSPQTEREHTAEEKAIGIRASRERMAKQEAEA